MKKIITEKEEGIAEIIDRMLGEEDETIVIVVPKGSVLGRSVKNFHLLKREAEDAGKSVSIESVDDTILAFAKESGIEGSHPLWRGVRGSGGMSDIVSAEEGADEEGAGESDEEEAPRPKKKTAGRKGKKDASVKLTVRTEHEEEEVQIEPTIGGEEGIEVKEETEEEMVEERLASELEETEEKEERFFASGRRSARGSGEDDEEEVEDEDEEVYGRRSSKKLIWVAAIAVVVILVGFYVVTVAFGHASVNITFKKTPWNNQGSFVADKAASGVNALTGIIPAQVFSTVKNTTQTFPASGHANVSLKAQGTLVIYNAYSSAPQDLVATTRFVTPDGKIYRIPKSVKIPGAVVTNGQITPSSVTTTIVADQAGPSFNIGPVAKLTIPGFQGTPRFDGFYGVMPNGAAGGFVGARAVPTAADISSAKTAVTQALQNNLTSSFTTSYPNNFKILPGATNVAISKLIVSTTTNDSGNFTVYGEATLQAIGFDESAFKDFLLSAAQATEPSSTWSSLALNYSNVQADFNKGRVAFTVAAQGALEPIFSADDFKAMIASKSIGEARLDIAALPQLSNGTISVWPMWLWGIPSNPDKIQLTAN